MQRVDYLLIGPSFPFRGGIAETQNELAKSLISLDKKVKLFTFKKLYPNFLFPGSTQLTSESQPKGLDIETNLHSYNPLNWLKIARKINAINPKFIVFRYYTPLLAVCYFSIMFKLKKEIKKIALVDNWTPHEPKFYDIFLNKLLTKKIDSYLTLSNKIYEELIFESNFNVFSGFHPINSFLPKKISKSKARKKLNWDINVPIILFYGLIRSYKGLDNLLIAFSKPPISLSNAKLAIVGEFYEPIKKYKLLIKKLKLEEKIYIIPKFADLNSTQLFFSSSDVIALTYKSATQSGVLPLAYNFEVPILTTNLLGLKTPIINDKSGLVCSNDPNEISKKLMEMLTLERKDFFIKNIKNSSKKYSWNEYSKQIINFLEQNN